MAGYDEMRSGRSLGDLFKELTNDLSALFRQELLLARLEMQTRMAGLSRDAALVVAGAMLVLMALLTLVAAAVLGLVAGDVRPWLACLIVALVLGVVGATMAGMRLAALRRRRLMPTETIASVKETATWLKHATR